MKTSLESSLLQDIPILNGQDSSQPEAQQITSSLFTRVISQHLAHTYDVMIVIIMDISYGTE